MQELEQAVVAIPARVAVQSEHLGAYMLPVHAGGFCDALGPDQLGQRLAGQRLAGTRHQLQAVADTQRRGEIPDLGAAGRLTVPDQRPDGEVSARPTELQPEIAGAV